MVTPAVAALLSDSLRAYNFTAVPANGAAKTSQRLSDAEGWWKTRQEQQRALRMRRQDQLPLPRANPEHDLSRGWVDLYA